MLVVTRFDVPPSEGEEFLSRARAALAAFAARPGYVRGRVGRAVDDASLWMLTTEWEQVADYRRSLSGFDVKVHGVTLLAQARDEISAFEVLATDEGAQPSLRAADADTTGPPKAPR